MVKKQKSIFEANINEIKWNCINSALAGLLVLAGSMASAESLTGRGVLVAICASVIVAVSQFKDYWGKEKKEYSKRNYIFAFV